MLVSFDSSTDRGEAAIADYQSAFDCSALLVFPNSAGTKCVWGSTDQVVVTFNTAGLNAVADDLVYLKASTLRSVFCVGVSATSSNCTYSDSSVAVRIAIPDNPITPAPVVTASQQIGNCDSITLDPTSSTGKGGRDWAAVTWFAEFTSKSSSSASNWRPT